MMRIYIEGGLFMAKMMCSRKKTCVLLGFLLAILALLLSDPLDVAGSHLSADTLAGCQTPAAKEPTGPIAFVFESDGSGTRAEGVYVDDIVLSAYMVARPPTTLTVCPDGSCDYTSIQDAIDEAIYGDIISVAPGTYKESITMVNGVRIKGSGVGQSIIDGDGAYRVVKAYGAGITNQAVLEGFTITGGVAPTSFNAGGGVLVETGASPTLVGNEIIRNTALHGAGIGVMFGASPDIQDNVISGNTAGTTGGGIYAFNSWPTIVSNTIAGNAGSYGGGIHARVGSYPTIVDNTIVSNTASNSGGGIWIGGWGSYPTGGILTGNTIRANTTLYFGGGIHIETNASVNLSNNTILRNTSNWKGGGVCVIGGSSLTSSEDTIVRNVAERYNGGGVVLDDHSSATISMATITDNRARDGGGISTAHRRGDSDLRLINSTVARNIATYMGGESTLAKIIHFLSRPPMSSAIVVVKAGGYISTAMLRSSATQSPTTRHPTPRTMGMAGGYMLAQMLRLL
jgi:hypothetical protein